MPPLQKKSNPQLVAELSNIIIKNIEHSPNGTFVASVQDILREQLGISYGIPSLYTTYLHSIDIAKSFGFINWRSYGQQGRVYFANKEMIERFWDYYQRMINSSNDNLETEQSSTSNVGYQDCRYD
ncbi:hypothetical protein BM613_13750 [Sulfoacidibacillus thermotolerans]|uniref:Uncharacterized protein n=2 Tax=Sulfoacidibacillus thermotolerans TaxID=1765684 RepID=A0A2U3CZB4_SULT2|nr:hypothetical protein BM613_13750 [Sulfoacidibacillus thermotolerans]